MRVGGRGGGEDLGGEVHREGGASGQGGVVVVRWGMGVGLTVLCLCVSRGVLA